MEKSIDLLKVAEEICKQNNFRLLAEKGEGTFKKTYSVNKGEEIYALKVYKPELLSQRGAREIDAMKRCNHPNIAKRPGNRPLNVPAQNFYIQHPG